MFTKVKLTKLIGTVYFKWPALLCLNLQEAHLILLSINIFYLPLLNIATHSINHSLNSIFNALYESRKSIKLSRLDIKFNSIHFEHRVFESSSPIYIYIPVHLVLRGSLKLIQLPLPCNICIHNPIRPALINIDHYRSSHAVKHQIVTRWSQFLSIIHRMIHFDSGVMQVCNKLISRAFRLRSQLDRSYLWLPDMVSINNTGRPH